MKQTRVLVVDDSPIVCATLKALLERDPEIEVVGVAHGADNALRLLKEHQPTIVTVDLSMPARDGVDLISELMHVQPVPVLVVTADAKQPKAFEALKSGALEVVAKPTVFGSAAAEFRRRVKALAGTPVIRRVARRAGTGAPPAPVARIEVLAVGASAGGPASIVSLLEGLGEDFEPPILIVQHLSERFADSFVRFLQNHTRRRVALCSDPSALQPFSVLVAPPSRHMGLDSRTHACLRDDAPEHGHRPSVDVLLRSVAATMGPCAAGVVLSGMGADGADGLLAMRRSGAQTFAEESAPVNGMPQAALDLGGVVHHFPVTQLGPRIAAMMPRGSGRR